MPYELISDYEPMGDQPQAIESLVNGLNKGYRFQTLLGVTGSGKTFTMANVIKEANRPVLIISPNKTLAAQLYSEFKAFFPNNKVEFFISYYDYYQPEAYVPTKDLYIEKSADINDVIARMRMSAIKSIMTRRDVIVVASVSAIYACGDPRDFDTLNIKLEVGQRINLSEFVKKLVKIGYERKEDIGLTGSFRLRGDTLEIFPSYQDEGIRIELFGDEIDRMYTFDRMNRDVIERLDRLTIYPTKEYVTTEEKIVRAVKSIREELDEQVKKLRSEGKELEAQRLWQRTMND
ncbi:MAG TPA: DEAD/DEAH box helicase family protein, partial [Fervidobacterium nodosum]|nr:DEAD/DEAH box helicase family protein [Fervidobacterium nodosum]